jgi:hypothetical protein
MRSSTIVKSEHKQEVSTVVKAVTTEELLVSVQFYRQ